MTKVLNHAQARMLTSDPLTQGMLLDPDAVMDNHAAWLANPQRELAKLQARMGKGMHGVVVMASMPDETVMQREARSRAEARRKAQLDALGPAAMAVAGEATSILTKRS